mgnify:CR=1 FL=1
MEQFTEADYRRVRLEVERRRLSFYRPYRKQQQFHKAGATYRERLLRSGNQMGKELLNGTPVLTPSGWKAIESLSIGDEVIGGDGASCYVTGVYPQGIKPVVEMIFDDGASVKAGYEHLWKCRQGEERYKGKNKGQWIVRSTAEIIKRGGASGNNQKVAEIPVCSSYIGKRELKIDPYVFGILAGDGCYSGTSAQANLSLADQEMLDAVGKFYVLRKSQGRKYDYAVTGAVSDLKWIGVWGTKSHEKSIPKDYLWNSAPNRLALLQGLMDTDGTAGKTGEAVFYSTAPALIDAVVFLARSLGGKAKISNRQTYFYHKGIKKAGRPSWSVRLTMPVCPFRLQRKAIRWQKLERRGLERRLISANPAGEGECTCISVDNADHTYVTKDFIVTHNTLAAAAETAMHATGRYPDWWEGKRFKKSPVIWCAGVTGEVVRDSIQRLLIGDVANPGTGFIPKEDIDDITPSRGVAGLVDTIIVKHTSGSKSRVRLKYYEQGREKFQADTVDFGWADEEPPEDIYSEMLTRTNATKGIMCLTFTPLKGVSNVVRRFLYDDSPDRIDINMTIDDALHISKEERKRIIDSYQPHEREARIYGAPVQGSGLIFPIEHSLIACDPFPEDSVPFFWQEIGGLDFGWDHPTAAVKILYNPQDDIIYVTNTYKRKEATPIIHAAALRSWGKNIPFAWPHDGLQHDKGSGEKLRDIYAAQGLNMLAEHATFEDGSNGVEAGITEMLMRMETGRLKVFSHLTNWFEEFRLYHRKEGKIQKDYDDLLCLHPDTAIITKRGIYPISELVGTTGKVLTINGKWVDYKNCRMTRANAELIEVTYNDGHKLLCTPNHKLLCHDGNWVSAIDSEGIICHNALGGELWNTLFTMVKNIENSVVITALQKVFFYIEEYGKSIMVKYHQNIIFITEMAIKTTMTLPIWNVFLGVSIYPNIRRGMGVVQYGRMLEPKNIENQRREKSIVKNLVSLIKDTYIQKANLYANSVERNTKERRNGAIDSVRENVHQNGEENQALILSKNRVDSVEEDLNLLGIIIRFVVRVVARLRCGFKPKMAQSTLIILKIESVKQRSDVYCMEVPDTNAMALVNGAIVHNCATRYAIIMLRLAARVRKVSGTINGWPIEESDLNPQHKHTYDYNPLSREICRGIKR